MEKICFWHGSSKEIFFFVFYEVAMQHASRSMHIYLTEQLKIIQHALTIELKRRLHFIFFLQKTNSALLFALYI